MGEVKLAVRFSCSSLINTINTYLQPLLPKMHYLSPQSVYQLDALRQQVVYLISLTLSNSRPPLKKEVIEYMLDVGSQTWSIRRSKANYDRVTTLLTGLLAMINWGSLLWGCKQCWVTGQLKGRGCSLCWVGKILELQLSLCVLFDCLQSDIYDSIPLYDCSYRYSCANASKTSCQLSFSSPKLLEEDVCKNW